MKDYINMNSEQIERLESVKRRYKQLYDDPANCDPMIIINVDLKSDLTWEEKLSDPMVMLKSKLDEIKLHFEVEDDFLPAARVDFGTGLIASAFGCDITVPANNLPAVRGHVLENIEDVYNLSSPSLETGMLGKMFEWMSLWRENLPGWVCLQQPDIQGPFNSSHLIRGNDILLDFYDAPEAVELLLDVVTDFTVRVLGHFNEMVGVEEGWFCDWGGAYFKGSARISNCSVDMISPKFYCDYVLPRDIRLFESVGGGRMHYCGGNGVVINQFFNNPGITGLDVDAGLHDLWEIAAKASEKLVLVFQNYGSSFSGIDRLLDGQWPDKRNIILYTNVETVDEGRDLLSRLRGSLQV